MASDQDTRPPFDPDWIRDTMPIVIRFHLVTDDGVRARIRGEVARPQPTQEVIVQGTWEADRLMAALPTLKRQRHLPYGGAERHRWIKD